MTATRVPGVPVIEDGVLISTNPATGEEAGPGAGRRRRRGRRDRRSGPGRPPLWWQGLGFDGRKARLLRWRSLIAQRIEELAQLTSLETGKPDADAIVEATARGRAPGLGRPQRQAGPRPAPDAHPAAGRRARRPPGIPAVRRGRRDRPVELPDPHPDRPDQRRAGGRQRGRLQAQRIHPDRRPVAGRHVRRGGARSSRCCRRCTGWATSAARCAAPASARSPSPAPPPPPRR